MISDREIPNEDSVQPNIAENLTRVRGEIDRAASAAGRGPADVTLVAVSKTKPAPLIQAAIDAGQKIFGENRLQEAEEKWPALKAHNKGVELHLIGPLQTNKVRKALELFDVIETVDRPKLARHLARLMAELDVRIPLYIQINTGEEEQKAGVRPAEADDFIKLCRAELALPVVGLMCIPPAEDEPALHFALLQKIAARNNIANLSMGMSADYETGITFGATHVRIGTAIFGNRA